VQSLHFEHKMITYCLQGVPTGQTGWAAEITTTQSTLSYKIIP